MLPKITCIIAKCGNRIHNDLMCAMHYHKLKDTGRINTTNDSVWSGLGSTSTAQRERTPIKERVNEKAAFSGNCCDTSIEHGIHSPS